MNVATWEKHLGRWRRQTGRAAVGFSGATAAVAPEHRPRTTGMPRSPGIARPTETVTLETVERIRRARRLLTTAGDELLILADRHELNLPTPTGTTEAHICAWTHHASGMVQNHVVNQWARRQITEHDTTVSFTHYRHGLEHLNRCVLELRMWLPATHAPTEVKFCACQQPEYGCPCKNCDHPREDRCICKPQPCPDQLLITDRDLSDRCRQRINRQHTKNTRDGAA